MSEKNIAIVLAAGQGRRMQTSQKKQYLLLEDKPILYYSLRAFEQLEYITDIIIVVGTNEEAYVQNEIVDRFHFSKVRMIVEGGKERYHSVYNGLLAVKRTLYSTRDSVWEESDTISINDNENVVHQPVFDDKCYIWIHDAARPFISQAILCRALECVRNEQACVIGMPVKDTIKIADENNYIRITPDRNLVWIIQTPQVFEYELVNQSYTRLMEQEYTLEEKGISITDDAMVVEMFSNKKVKLVEGDYKNIKITTPEDLQIARVFEENEA